MTADDRFAAILSHGVIFIGGEPASLIVARARRKGLVWGSGSRYQEGCQHHECVDAARKAGLIRDLTPEEIAGRMAVLEKTNS